MQIRLLPLVIFFLLSPVAFAQQALQEFTGAESKFGFSVAILGDIDADGAADFAVGNGGTSPFPAVRIYSGKTGTQLFAPTTTQKFDGFGVCVAATGDVNGDGFPDLVAGSWILQLNFLGYAKVISGKDGTTLYTFTGSAADRYGSVVAGPGDVNLDGFADVLVAAPQANAAFLYSGKDGSLLSTFTGGGGEYFGKAMAGVGDVNHDGNPDILIGSPRANCCADLPGRARLYSGQTGALLFTFNGTNTNDRFGAAISDCGDWNGDGTLDVLIGAPGMAVNNNNYTYPGQAQIFSGADGSLLTTFSGSSPSAHLGYALASLGDVDNDGFNDLALGSINDEPVGGKDTGSVRIISGKTSATLYTIYGATTNAGFARSLARGGDLDGDGFPDLLVGVPYFAGFYGEAISFSLLPQGIAFYGSGVAGCSGKHLINAIGVPSVGNAQFQLTASHAALVSRGYWIVGLAKDPLGTNIVGIPLWINLASTNFLLPYTANPAGYVSTPLPIPGNSALKGLSVFAQFVSLWEPTCTLPPLNISASGGMSLTIQ